MKCTAFCTQHVRKEIARGLKFNYPGFEPHLTNDHPPLGSLDRWIGQNMQRRVGPTQLDRIWKYHTMNLFLNGEHYFWKRKILCWYSSTRVQAETIEKKKFSYLFDNMVHFLTSYKLIWNQHQSLCFLCFSHISLGKCYFQTY